MKKIILCMLVFCGSMNAGWLSGERQAVEKGQAFDAINGIIQVINEKDSEFTSPHDKWFSYWVMNDMLDRLATVLQNNNITGIDRSLFDKWVQVLENIAKKKKAKFRINNLDEATILLNKQVIYKEYPDYTQKAFTQSEVYTTHYVPALKTQADQLHNTVLNDDDTLIEASEKSSISEVKSPKPHQKEITAKSEGTASDDGDRSELASDLSDDCTLVEQLKKNEQESEIQRFLNQHPIIRAAGLTAVLLIAYKIYLQAQEHNLVVVDTNQQKIKVQNGKTGKTIYQRK